MSPETRPGTAARFRLAVTGQPVRSEIVLQRRAIAGLAGLLREHAPAARYAIVADERVAGTHGRAAVAALRDAGHTADLFSMPGGDRSKTLGRWAELVERLAETGVGRDGAIIAVGGGVTGDLAGFAAAVLARGITLVQLPTTLLAMVDAAIGGKTGVDLHAGKNLAGAFHHPRLIVIDADTLETLPPGTFKDGLAEAIKHGAVADADYFDWIASAAPDLARRDPTAIDRLVAGSVRIKVDIVSRDPREHGERAALNFGHTIAHAIERATAYDVPHGQAVALGMVIEARVGELARITDPGTTDRIRAALAAADLPADLPPDLVTRAPDILHATRVDKKARDGHPRYALIRAIGTPARTDDGAWTHPITTDIVQQCLR